MPWTDFDKEERAERPVRKAKVCAVCHRYILNKDNLIVVKGVAYCLEHAPHEDDDGKP